ncbi:hypothetical protein C8Q78DRAFT_1070679 [Trametes maxima]|nr:hypothetical protein C8Q78DRAFT_1070679 [Trametes maxima]
MAFAAPVPRLPLASVLRELDASWAPRSPEASAPTNGHAHSADATQGPFWDVEKNQSQGLGLVLGAACLPIQLPLSQLDFEPQSPPRYSRRLRSLAPAPLQLASPTPRAPLRTLTQAHTPAPGSALRTSCSAAFVDIQLGPKCASAFADAVSVSPQSERRTSASSTMASWSTAPTSLVFPGDSENMVPGRSTNPSQLGMLSWQRSLDTPSSAFPPKSANAGPSVLRKAALTPLTSPRKSNFAHDDPFTPGLPLGAAPPPLRRTEVVPLPELTNEELPPPDFLFSSPLDADLWLDLGVEDLVLRAENCSETIARASMSLCSCSLLRDPKSIANLCDKLRATFTSVQRALDGTPAEFSADGSDAKGIWYAKHWQVISSLDRNLNLFYLLARQIEDRPPRIHRLAPLVDKLSTYQSKFADLARRIVLSHEKLRFLGLRNQLSASHAFLRAPVDDARVLRHTDARAARQEGRARRREIREEITRVRGRIRAIRERDAALGPNDENMSPYDEDEDKSMNMVVDGEKRRRGRP